MIGWSGRSEFSLAALGGLLLGTWAVLTHWRNRQSARTAASWSLRQSLVSHHLRQLINALLGIMVMVLTLDVIQPFRKPVLDTAAQAVIYQVITLHNLSVFQDFDDGYTHQFMTEDDSNLQALGLPKGTVIKGTFCRTYKPAFEAGQHLIVLKYEDRQVCWDVFNQHPKYLIKRNADGDTINDIIQTAQTRRQHGK
jgi:hypothetical protein